VISLFSPPEVSLALNTLFNFFKENIILTVFIFSSYILFYLYSFIHSKGVDSDIYEMDVLSSGVSSAMTALLLLGLDESSKKFALTSLNFSDPTSRMAILLLAYAIMLIFFAFMKALPRLLVILFGNSELDLLINLLAVLSIDSKVHITGTLVGIIAIPLFVLLILQRAKRAIS